MERERFYDFVRENIADMLPEEMTEGAEFSVQDISKTSGIYTGLVMRKPDLTITPTINLDGVYEKYQTNPEQGLDEVANMVKEHVGRIMNGGMKDIVDLASKMSEYKNAKQILVVAPISEKRGIAMPDVPQQEIEGLHFVVKMQFSADKDGVAAAVVKQSHMESWGVSKEDLFNDAWENMKNLRPGKLSSMTEILSEMIGSDPVMEDILSGDMEMPMYVYTNEMRTDGAAGFFAPGVMDEIAEKLGGENYYMFPSSIHECIVVPENVLESTGLKEMKDMIEAGNATITNPAEILSETPFHFDAKEHRFEKAEDYMARAGLLEEEVVEEYEMNIPAPKMSAVMV